MAKAVVKKAKAAAKKPRVETDPCAALYGAILDESEKKYELDDGDISQERVPTDILMLDLMLNGGVTAGMYLVAGKSQSAKSTVAFGVLAGMEKLGVPILKLADAEGSAAADRQYVANIFQSSIEKLFGKKVNGEFVIHPRLRYSRNNLLRTFFDDIVHTLKRLPDKVYIAERNAWFLRVNINDKKISPWAAKLSKVVDADPKLSNKKYKYFISNPYPQAVIVPDSYSAFVPEDVDEAEEASDRRALMAGEYSQNLRRVVGKLSKKFVVWWGVNQLRLNPGKSMGNPEYEPNGEALQFFANLRMHSKHEWVPEKWKNKGNKYTDKHTISYEPSVEGKGEDGYSYKSFVFAKNKLGCIPGKAFLRVWTKDHTGKGRGIDPVFDVLQVLETLQYAKVKNGKSRTVQFSKEIKNTVKDGKHPFVGKSLEWADFKILILAEYYKTTELKDRAAKIYKHMRLDKPFYLRKWCKDMIADGSATHRRMEVASNREDKSDDEDLED